ncbi:L-threonine 3-dehydrogenase [[Leptolyngbya] sp. PCC 7376]|uniref:NAD-dependent epimerase/dehydratase family protein n=1 Tax=[Leptolyngbya] sp. PCC 7376 TaxID=111781 RepID=UPI00029ED978|nr:NAD-dependent epimerase/dehydratase family protein [[Leptolyngbya] sp. PCC 7376]AFY36877.1 L-threonine 3-dehydrogenase [[Leptolyngbya] sp. PCC 7376]
MTKVESILITGANGQIGSDLAIALHDYHGVKKVIETGRRLPSNSGANRQSYRILDVTDIWRLQELVEQDHIDTIYHLAGVLSATGEMQPYRCWQVNIEGLRNVLEVAKAHQVKVFWPSSIAVFGANTPKINTPQIVIEDPSTMYGITKSTGEMLCHYYADRFGVDVRSLRLPGIISHRTLPGGGTTDFAVEIFYDALKFGNYSCFVRPDTRLPMMYMPDAIAAILGLMDAKSDSITVRSSYNIAAVSFSAAELVAEIQKHLPDFSCDYAPDFRQAIADSWPMVIDDSQARQDWGWQHHYDLSAIVTDMLQQLSRKGIGN